MVPMTYSVREQEHMKDTKQLKGAKLHQSLKETVTTEIPQSGLTDHAEQKNHTIDWEGVRLPTKESNFKNTLN